MGIKRALRVGILALLVLVGLSGADIAKDKEECANQLAGLATCLPYVSGTSKAPTPDCCTGLNQVLKTSKQCLCLLVKDRNDPSLGLKINATLALSLPLTCHAPASAANVTQCPALLHLPPNSPDAKVFYDFATAAPSSNASTTVSSGKSGSGEASAAQTSSGSERWLEAKNQMVFAVFTLCFTSLLIFITPIN